MNNINSFSPFTLASVTAGNALPVILLSFNATILANRSVLLQWATAEEINNAYFEVQRSTDATNWNVIRQVLPESSHEYSAIDNTVHEGTCYYRIRQVDKDGKYIYSIVKVLKIPGDNKLFIWPNPVSDKLYIQTGFSKGSIEITDVSGRVVLKKNNNQYSNLCSSSTIAKRIVYGEDHQV